MNSSLHTGDQGTVKTVDFTRRTHSEEGQDGSINRKDDGYCFLECARRDLHRLFGEGKSYQRAVLC